MALEYERDERSVSALRRPCPNPSTVQLSPQVVNELCGNWVVGDTVQEVGATGLLFGTAEQDLVSVQACKAFALADSSKIGSPKRECLDAAIERLLATAKMDRNLASLHLIGWYSVRGTGETTPLRDDDIEFHNRLFRRATDVALILKPEQHAGVSIELYSRPASTIISKQYNRSGSLVLSTEVLGSEPVNVTMRATIDDDYYFVTPEVKTVPTFQHERIQVPTPWHPMSAPPSSDSPLNGSPVHNASPAQLGDPPTPPSKCAIFSRASRTKLPGISAAALFVLAAALTSGWVYWRWGVSAPATRLGVQVVRKEGNLLVGWDRHSNAVMSAKDGILRIDDGTQHRKIHLDARQIANASILYRPTSKDVTFRLDVFGDQASLISDIMRVADKSESTSPARAGAATRPIAVSKVAPLRRETGAQRRFRGSSRRNANPLVPSEKPFNSRIAGTEPASPPDMKFAADLAAPSLPVGSGIDPLPPSIAPSTRPESNLQATPSTHPPKREVSERERPSNPTPSPPRVDSAVQNLVSTDSRGRPVQRALAGTGERAFPGYAPARVLKQVLPDAKALPITPNSASKDVEVEVRIDDDGHVTEAHAVNHRLNNNALLAGAALAAAKEWIFEPAKLYGKSVPSEHTIEFHFRPQVGQK